MIDLPLAFLLGFLGSAHCAVMCGPIMLSLPFQKTSYLANAFQILLYQLGRIIIYTFLGVCVGFLGNSLKLVLTHETVSLLIGSLLIVFALLHFFNRIDNKFNGVKYKITAPISKLLGKLYGLKFWGFYAGLLNGLIPCGMVYLALATSLNSKSISEAGSFMLLFGLGTTPLMLMISLGGFYLKKIVNFNPNRLIPAFTFLIGILFILRSLSLGIPFLSPNMPLHAQNKVEVCN